MKKQQIQILDGDNLPGHIVDAEPVKLHELAELGVFVHKTVGDEGYTVTHGETGAAFCMHKFKKGAIQKALELVRKHGLTHVKNVIAMKAQEIEKARAKWLKNNVRRVYIVRERPELEQDGQRIFGVYSTEGLAVEAARKYRPTMQPGEYEVEAFVVDAPF